jgi:hypothetical protein
MVIYWIRSAETSLAHQGLSKNDKSLYVNLIFAQIEYLEGPIPLQHLCDVGNPALLPYISTRQTADIGDVP